MSISVNDKVESFTLLSSNGERVSLHDYLGKKVVLYFYPKDMTPGCTTESCSFRDFHGDLIANDVTVLGISPDDLSSHQKFVKKYELPFLLLSDTEQVVSQYFDVWKEKSMYGKKYMGVERSTFLIGADGTLLKEWRKVKVDGHVDDVLSAVKSL